MTRFLASRLLQAAALLLVMSLAVYLLIGLMPGDPIDLMIQADPHLGTADRDRLYAIYGLDRPLLERYGAWLGDALQGDFGYSRQFHRPVLEILLPRLGNTLLLLAAALLLALIVAVPLGVMAARRPGGAFDMLANLFCFAGVSVPPFWLALMLIMLFAVTLRWLPASGAMKVGDAGLLARLPYLVMPVLCLTLLSIASHTRFLRAAMIGEMRQDYIRTARAKGASEARVLWRHALKNAAIPFITVLGLDIGALFSGALITETMFAYPGMGKTIYDSIMGSDYNLALVGLLLATAMVLLGNLLADLAYGWVDPRVRRR